MRDSVFKGAFGFRKLITGFIAAGAMLLGLTGTAAAYTISVTPQSQTTTVGSQVSVSLFASDFAPGRGLGSYNFDFSFESSVLGFNSLTDGLGMPDAIGLMWGLSGGVLTVTDTSFADPLTLLAQQSPNIALFTVVFDALAEGTSFLDISGVVLSDAWGDSSEMGYDLFNGSVTVSQVTTPVPEPGVWALMLLGAVLVAWMKRRDAAEAAGRTRLSGLDSLALRG